MIEQITGTVLRAKSGRIVVETGGVGLSIYVPEAVERTAQEGEVITLYLTMLFRNDSFELFGFASPEDRDFFNLLKTIPSIGPKTALKIISELGLSGIQEAVINKNPVAFQRISGVGKKTAQRILVELSEKMASLDGLEISSPLVDEARAALKQLGYSKEEVDDAIASCDLSQVNSTEELLRKALEYLGKKRGR